MLAPPEARPGLLALYAFNLEIARAPFVSREAMIAEIRLRWWGDAIAEICDGAAPRRHEVVEPLAAAIRASGLPRALFFEMIEARALDIDRAPFESGAALERYLSQTAGHLMELAARHLGAGAAALPVIRDFARGAGHAAWLRALPDLAAHGRGGLPPGVTAPDLARDGLALITRARARRAEVPAAAAPALLAGALAAPRLARAMRGASMELSEFQARATWLWRGLTGRW
ncbi:MAG: phytoene synthase [Rhodovulum sulfidophilum]|uniref:Phytoene synthase n=1 Tax=Rhodovulum sulfidophilum TaxID=35806 RepID=A0A2W5PZW8_RHOSU|nr:MAG: phytoene synthase [Rhodovulum sulfidophilum]